MPKDHVLESGEAPAELAAAAGFGDWKTIYEHPANAALRKLRATPAGVYPGDVVKIPDPDAKAIKVATGQSHPFVVRRPSSVLNVIVQDAAGTPIAGKPFQLRSPALATPLDGTTTGDGRVECELPPAMTDGQLIVWADKKDAGARYTWNLELAALLAPEDDDGIRQRLNNLGYYAGELGGDDARASAADSDGADGGDEAADGVPDERLRFALRAFQEDNGLHVTGELDDGTRAAIVKAHGKI